VDGGKGYGKGIEESERRKWMEERCRGNGWRKGIGEWMEESEREKWMEERDRGMDGGK
jgi:hypothetical protein